MIITDKFVFIHYPKTGGSFVEEVLKKLHKRKHWFRRPPLCQQLMMPNLKKIRGANICNPHGTYEQIPEEHKGKPIVSCMRNPFDRYVSTYEYRNWRQQQSEELEQILRQFPSFPELTFEEYLSFINIFDIKSRVYHELLRVDIGTTAYTFFQFFFKNTEKVFQRLDEAYLNSDEYKKDMPEITFLRNESLNLDLYNILLKFGYPEEDVSFIIHEKMVNVTSRRNARRWHEYYRKESYEYVKWKERFIFRLFPEYMEAPPLFREDV
jgi:hypothetical protein